MTLVLAPIYKITMMDEEPSDWDSMSDPATEDQQSSLENSGKKSKDNSKNVIDNSANIVEGQRQQDRPKTAYKRTLDSPNLKAQKQRIQDGIRNQSFDLSENGKSRTDSFNKFDKSELGTPLPNKVYICNCKYYFVSISYLYNLVIPRIFNIRN
jgi:hypothetical protein